MFIMFLWSRECIGTAHRHEIAVTVDKWYLLVLVTRLTFPLQGKTQTGSPCDLDHLGFKGLHMLQKGLHGLSCVNYGLRGGKSKGREEEIWRKERGIYESKKKIKITDFFIFCLPGGGRFFCTFKVFQALWRSFKLCLWTLAGFHVFSPCTRPSEEFWDNLWAACHKNTFHYEKCQR